MAYGNETDKTETNDWLSIISQTYHNDRIDMNWLDSKVDRSIVPRNSLEFAGAAQRFEKIRYQEQSPAYERMRYIASRADEIAEFMIVREDKFHRKQTEAMAVMARHEETFHLALAASRNANSDVVAHTAVDLHYAAKKFAQERGALLVSHIETGNTKVDRKIRKRIGAEHQDTLSSLEVAQINFTCGAILGETIVSVPKKSVPVNRSDQKRMKRRGTKRKLGNVLLSVARAIKQFFLDLFGVFLKQGQ